MQFGLLGWDRLTFIHDRHLLTAGGLRLFVMNVLYLHTHDMGRWNSAYGYPLPTPNMLQLARESTVFRQAHCAAPTCSPSRAAMLTGQSAHQSGMLGLVHRGFRLANPERHLASYLRQNGFNTALFGVQHEFSWDKANEFYDHYVQPHSIEVPPGTNDSAAADAFAHWLTQRNEKKPFFAAIGFYAPHRPFVNNQKDTGDYRMPPPPLPDNAMSRQDFADYAATLQLADEAVGKVLQVLKQTQYYDETCILFTTDHGPAFPFMKCNLTDHGTGVTLMIRDPRQSAAVGVSDALVSHIDVFPTVCEVTGVAVPPWAQGYSLIPLLDDPHGSVRDRLHAEVTYHAAYEPMRSVRTQRYKLIRNYLDESNTRVLPNIDRGATKTFLMDHGLRQYQRPREELYDLYMDPYEGRNLVDHPDYQNVLQQMRFHLDQWMKDTQDPLLQSTKVPAPTGARVTPPNADHPDG